LTALLISAIIVEMHLSSGSRHDAPEGCNSIAAIGEAFEGSPLLMDRAYKGDETRAPAARLQWS